MSTLILPQLDDVFGSNDLNKQMDGGECPPEEADSMDTTRPSSPSPPALEDEENDENCKPSNSTCPEINMEESIDQMIDDELGLDEEEDDDKDEPADPNDIAHASLDAPLEPLKAYNSSINDEKCYGGISNLMNTCYMASALQMLASVDSFIQLLREQAPRENSPLRNALLDLWDRIERGETVRPEEVKRVIDERSCLFEGNEQQDAHEFLTTLLDLLDEDYKAKENSAATPEAPETSETASVKDEGEMDVDEDETPCKRMKTCPPEEDDVKNSALDSCSSHTTGSFAELDVHQIEQLLHGSMSSSREGMIMPSPHTPMSCRLVGGRMNPTQNSPFWSPHKSPTTVDASPRVENSQTEQPVGESTSGHSQPAALVPNHESETKPVKSSSPIDECFTTKVRVRLTCDSCKYTRTQEETYLHWSLEMSGDTSVDEVVRRFFAPERREVKCEKCFGEFATQTSHITQLPKMLLLHFKRFVVKVSEDYSSISYEKNSSSVAFDPTISTKDDLQDYMAVDCHTTPGSRYHIRSVVNHHGSSVSFGHYTADANRTVAQDGGREWRRFNDSFVSKISEQQAVQESSRSAYLVMYELE